MEPWSWDLLEKENGEYLLIRAIPEESQKCLLCDILTENRDNKIRDHTKIYFIFGHVRCPICHSLIQIATHRKDITVSGCPHLKQWVFDNNELMMTLTPDNTDIIAILNQVNRIQFTPENYIRSAVTNPETIAQTIFTYDITKAENLAPAYSLTTLILGSLYMVTSNNTLTIYKSNGLPHLTRNLGIDPLDGHISAIRP